MMETKRHTKRVRKREKKTKACVNKIMTLEDFLVIVLRDVGDLWLSSSKFSAMENTGKPL